MTAALLYMRSGSKHNYYRMSDTKVYQNNVETNKFVYDYDSNLVQTSKLLAGDRIGTLDIKKENGHENINWGSLLIINIFHIPW
jgi:hypothetical protein